MLSVIVCTIGAEILQFITFFIFFVGPAYGAGIAEMILWITGRKRGPLVEAVGVGSIIVGALIAYFPHVLGAFEMARTEAASKVTTFDPSTAFSMVMLGILWPVIGVALAAGVCYTRLRE